MIKIRGNNPILTLKANFFFYISSTSTLISFKPSQQGFILQDDQNKGKQPYTYSKTSHFPSYLININSDFFSNLHNRVLFCMMIKIRGNNPILTLKANIFLHISSTSTPISFKPSQQGFILQDDQNKG